MLDMDELGRIETQLKAKDRERIEAEASYKAALQALKDLGVEGIEAATAEIEALTKTTAEQEQTLGQMKAELDTMLQSIEQKAQGA